MIVVVFLDGERRRPPRGGGASPAVVLLRRCPWLWAREVELLRAAWRVVSLAFALAILISPSFAAAATPVRGAGESWRGPVAGASDDDGDLLYSTLLGGESLDWGLLVTRGADGAVYLAGETRSSDFPATDGAYDCTYNGGTDAFVVKLDPSDWHVVFATVIGGSGIDGVDAMFVDVSGAVYLAGDTNSGDFPTTLGALSRQLNGGSGGMVSDAYVLKLAPSGSALLYSTYLGAAGVDRCRGVWADAGGNAWVAGLAGNGFPTTDGALDRTLGGTADGFLAKLNADGSALLYSTLLGGSGSDTVTALAVDGSGAIYLGGTTYSSDFPVSAGAFDDTRGGPVDGFVTKLSADASTIVYSTYLGGTTGGSSLGSDEDLAGLVVDGDGSAYVAGTTYSADFPTTPGAYDRTFGGGVCGVSPLTYACPDAYVTRLAPSGAYLVYSTFVGGAERDEAAGLALDAAGHVYLTGRASSTDFPTTASALQAEHPGGTCGSANENYPCPAAYALRLDATGSGVLYATFIGGTLYDYGYAIALAGADQVMVSGYTASTDFPTTPDALDTTMALGDAFLSLIEMPPAMVERRLFLPLHLSGYTG